MKNRKMFFAACAAVASVAICGSAVAQDTTTTTTTQTTTTYAMSPGNHISVGDEILLMNLIHANAVEIALSRIAYRQASSKGVSDYARMMMDDHQNLQNQLMTTYGNQSWVTNWEHTSRTNDNVGNSWSYMDNDSRNNGNWGNWMFIDGSDWDRIHHIRDLTGFAFDKEYVDMMAYDHQCLLDKLNQASMESSNSDIKSLISSVQPTVQKHLEEARMFAFKYDDPANMTRHGAWIH